LGVQNERPVVKKKAPTPHYDVTAAIIRYRGKYLITQRPLDKLLGGLWEFPGGKQEAGESLQECLEREIQEELGMAIKAFEQRLTLKHGFTHFKITLHVFEAEWLEGKPSALQVADFKWVKPEELGNYAMGKTDRAIARWVSSNVKRQT
jgi:A/G-specific adenine glycosylase